MSVNDVVYFLTSDPVPNGGAELRYSLRSLAANLPHGDVYVIGGKPDWVTNVHHIKHVNDPRGKWWNLMAKAGIAAQLQGPTDVCYFMGDDFYITRPVDEVQPTYTNTIQKRYADVFKTRNPLSVYGNLFVETEKVLDRIGSDRYNNHNLHLPQVLQRSSIPVTILHKAEAPLAVASLVGNIQDIDPVQISHDRKVTTEEALRDWSKGNDGFLSSSDRTFTRCGVEAVVKSLFPDPCRYEA